MGIPQKVVGNKLYLRNAGLKQATLSLLQYLEIWGLLICTWASERKSTDAMCVEALRRFTHGLRQPLSQPYHVCTIIIPIL